MNPRIERIKSKSENWNRDIALKVRHSKNQRKARQAGKVREGPGTPGAGGVPGDREVP
jgi:hypothetical protein